MPLFLVGLLASLSLFAATPDARAGGSVVPCVNCKLGFTWLDSDSASGVLKVSSKCRARRTILVYGGVGRMDQIGKARSNRLGRWNVNFSPNNPIVFVLLPKDLGPRTCRGGSALHIVI
jgi:hypothetical protein